MSKPIIFFDIEAGGLEANLSSIYSISARLEKSEPTFTRLERSNWYAYPQTESYWSYWTRKNIWARIAKKKAEENIRIGTEERALRDFISYLEKQKTGSTLAGWNIGYDIEEQGGRVRGYDIPYMLRRARKYGLKENLAKQLGRFKIRDIGAEYAYSVASAAARNKSGIVNPELLAGAEQYLEVSSHLSNKAEAARLSAKRFRMAGWKQELMYELFTGKELSGAHMSDIDITAASVLSKKTKRWTNEKLIRWNRQAVINKLTASALKGQRADDPDRWGRIIGRAHEESQRVSELLSSRRWRKKGEREALESYTSLVDDLIANVKKVGAEKGVDFADVTTGRVRPEVLDQVGRSVGKDARESIFESAAKRVNLRKMWAAVDKRTKVLAGIGLGLGALWMTEPMQYISGRDDDYNSIEGMSHRGLSGYFRKLLTDFGSGFLGKGGKFVANVFSREARKYFAEAADDKALKSLYKKAARRFHPDAGGTLEEMQALNNIWDEIRAAGVAGKARWSAPPRASRPRGNRWESSWREAWDESYRRQQRQQQHQQRQYYDRERRRQRQRSREDQWNRDQERAWRRSEEDRARRAKYRDEAGKKFYLGLAALGLSGLGLAAWSSRKREDLQPQESQIEALRHEGEAGDLRKLTTDFGSGYQGFDLAKSQKSDKKITEDEWRQFVRKTRVAMAEGKALELIKPKELKASIQDIKWPEPPKDIKFVTGEAPDPGQFGWYRPDQNILAVHNRIDPKDFAASYSYMLENPRQGESSLDWIYSVADPRRVKETVLHEGLHGVWDEYMNPAHKQTFIEEAWEQIPEPGFFTGWNTYGPDVEALYNKSPTYAQQITAAKYWRYQGKDDQAKPFVEWVANEMFAHRGALHRYKGLGYEMPANRQLDGIVSQYVQEGPTIDLSAATRGFDPNKAIRENFNEEELQRLAAAGAQKKQARYGRFASEQKRSLPTSLMGVPIDPRILEFRRDVWDVKPKRLAMEERVKEAQEAALAKMGEFEGSDFLSFDSSTVRGLNTKRQDLARVKLSDFIMNVEDADTVMLRRKGVLPWIQSLFGRGEVAVRLAGIDAPEVAGHKDDPIGFLRMWQEQPGGAEATRTLQNLVAQQKDLSLIVSKDERTYGRYLGVLAGDEGKNLNLELIRRGAVTALPFGPTEKDIVSRAQARQAEEQAWNKREGVWQYARYKAIRAVTKEVGRPITHNTLTNVQKLASNLNLGAYASWLDGFGASKREINWAEIEKAQQMGRALKKTHGEPRRKKRYPKVEFQKEHAAKRKLRMADLNRRTQITVTQAARDGGSNHSRQRAGGFVQ